TTAGKTIKESAPRTKQLSDEEQWAGSKKAALNTQKTLWFEKKGDRSRIHVEAVVCLREGQYGLECLLCRKHTKEHESILSTSVDATEIHRALLATGAEPGSPVEFKEKDGKFEIVPPKGARLKVLFQYEDKGKRKTVKAQEWVVNNKTKKDLDQRW